MQTNGTTPKNVGTCSVSWEGYNPKDWKTCVMHVRGPTMLEELSKRLQYCCATLRGSQNKLLGFVGSNVWLVSNFEQQFPTTRNNMQKQTTGCTYGRDMLHPTMLGVVGLQCCACLHRALHIVSWYCRLRALEKQAMNSLCHSEGLRNISVVSLLGDFCRNFEV